MANNKIIWEVDSLTPGLEHFEGRLHLMMKGFFQYEESKVQDFMRTSAPWTDRTGNARQGLFAKAFGDGRTNTHGIICYHTMPYGVWLEVKNSGEYAVIVPTIQQEGARIMQGLNGLLSRMRALG